LMLMTWCKMRVKREERIVKTEGISVAGPGDVGRHTYGEVMQLYAHTIITMELAACWGVEAERTRR
jgi:hypothetical protein